MAEFRFILEPYKGSKHQCPSCGQNTFVRYIDNETGEYLSDEVGRCDREDKCGYHYPPRKFFEDYPEERSKYIEKGRTMIHQEQQKPKNFVGIDSRYVDRSQSDRSNFIRFLRNLLDADIIERLITTYRIGATKDGSVIFWQIDTQKVVHTGKIMQYDPETGHRRKDLDKPVDWVHSRLK